MDAKGAYIEKIKALLKEWKTEVEHFEAEAEMAAADKKIEKSEEADSLKNQVQALEDKLDDLKMTSEDTWDQVRMGVESTVDEVRQSFKQALHK